VTDAGVLCEFCGYRLDGLRDDGNCPECGQPIRLSTVDSPRRLTRYERDPCSATWWATSRRVWLRPGRSFRELKTRVGGDARERAERFGEEHIFAASALAGLALVGHLALTLPPIGLVVMPPSMVVVPVAVAVAWGPSAFVLALVTFGLKRLVAWLTVWEASWRQMRLDREVVRRGLDYHAAHLTPVCGVVLLVVAFGHLAFGLRLAGPGTFFAYLIALSSACVVGAAWLFWTYWLAMSNMLRANV